MVLFLFFRNNIICDCNLVTSIIVFNKRRHCNFMFPCIFSIVCKSFKYCHFSSLFNQNYNISKFCLDISDWYSIFKGYFFLQNYLVSWRKMPRWRYFPRTFIRKKTMWDCSLTRAKLAILENTLHFLYSTNLF